MTNGDTAAASAALRAALAANPHVPPCLPGSRTLPKHLPEIIALGETSEAIEHAVDATGRWQWVPGACDWLRRAWSGR